MAERSIYLYCTEGSADKEYHVHLRAQQGLWMVDYANGPRGKVSKAKSKTTQPVSLEEANKVFDALVKAKKKQNPPYTEAETGVRFTNSESGERFSGRVLQQPTPINGIQADQLDEDDAYAAQEKANGERRPVEIGADGVVQGINKRGYYVNVPETWATQFRALGPAAFDGEHVGETLFVFDLLELNGRDLRELPFKQRYAMLASHLEGMGNVVPSMKLLEAAFTSAEKKALQARMAAQGREGVVYKHVDGAYDSGRSQNTLKYPFYESSTCIVLKQNSQRSVLMGLQNSAGTMLPVGNVTIPGNFPIPEVGALGDVRYLYYNPEGAFEQPVYLGPNQAATADEALLTQVSRLKPGVGMDELGRRIAVADAPDGEAELCVERQRG